MSKWVSRATPQQKMNDAAFAGTFPEGQRLWSRHKDRGPIVRGIRRYFRSFSLRDLTPVRRAWPWRDHSPAGQTPAADAVTGRAVCPCVLRSQRSRVRSSCARLPHARGPAASLRRDLCGPLKTRLAPPAPTGLLLCPLSPEIEQAERKSLRGISTAMPMPAPPAPMIWRNCSTPCRRCGSAISRCRMAGDRVGIIGKIADTFNEIVATNQRMARAARAGRAGGRPRRPHPAARALRPR